MKGTKKTKEPKPRKKALIAQYEIRVGKNGKVCEFNDDVEDVMIVDMFNKQTMGWNIAEAKEKMGLKQEAPDKTVIPYLLNTLLIAIQETDWSKVKKSDNVLKKSKKKAKKS